MRQIEFYTSVGGSALEEGLLREWEVAGWRTKRCFAITQETYRLRGGRARRYHLRWQMYVKHAWRCWVQTQRGENGVIRVVTTNPFFAPCLVQTAAGGRGATINLLYDLFPDALVSVGLVREHSLISRACAAITRRTLRECSATVFLGERLRRYAESTYGPARLGVVIPVGADAAPFRNNPPQAYTTSPIRVLYCGQMGRLHDTRTLRETILRGLPDGIEFVFHAGGGGYTGLRRSCAAASRCQWHGPLPEKEWTLTMKTAQVALVTMMPGAQNVVMPSKTYSALVAGQAILAVCPRESDLADLVRLHDCGWVIEPGDLDGLFDCLRRMVKAPRETLEKRRRAFAAGHESYDSTAVARKWEELFRQVSM